MNMNSNVDIKDVARWFLAKQCMTQKKLQKLCYYAVAWGYALRNENENQLSLTFTTDTFEAWVHGPVSPTLYAEYKHYMWKTIPRGSRPEVPEDIKELLEAVWDTYGHKDGHELELLSHQEMPWIEARGSLGEFDRCSAKISPKTMFNFYRSIYQQ